MIKRNEDSSPALSEGDTSQTPQWTPEATGTTEPCGPYVFSYIHILMIKFNLYDSHIADER